MKKFYSLRMGLLILISAAALISCSGKSEVLNPNPPGGGGGGTTPDPTIDWYVTPITAMQKDTAFYGDSKNLSAVGSNADSTWVDDQFGTYFSTGPITGMKSYTAHAKNKSTGKMFTSTKYLYAYTPVKSNITGGAQGVKWGMDSSFRQLIPDSLATPNPTAWTNGLFDSSRYQYFTNNTMTTFILSGPAAGQHSGTYSLVMPESSFPYNETHISSPGTDLRRIETVTLTKLVLTQRQKVTNGAGFVIYRWIYSPK